MREGLAQSIPVTQEAVRSIYSIVAVLALFFLVTILSLLGSITIFREILRTRLMPVVFNDKLLYYHALLFSANFLTIVVYFYFIVRYAKIACSKDFAPQRIINNTLTLYYISLPAIVFNFTSRCLTYYVFWSSSKVMIGRLTESKKTSFLKSTTDSRESMMKSDSDISINSDERRPCDVTQSFLLGMVDDPNQDLMNRKPSFLDFGGILMSAFVYESQPENPENSLRNSSMSLRTTQEEHAPRPSEV